MADTPKCRHCGEGQDAHLADALECADDDGNWIGTFWTPTPEPAPDVPITERDTIGYIKALASDQLAMHDANGDGLEVRSRILAILDECEVRRQEEAAGGALATTPEPAPGCLHLTQETGHGVVYCLTCKSILAYDPAQRCGPHCEACMWAGRYAALARPAEPRAAEDWRSFPDDLRAIVLDDLDRESDSEDVTDAYQTARRLLLSAAEPPPTARPAEPRSDVVEQIEKLQERWTVPTTAGDVPHPYYVPETERDAAVSLMRGLGWTVEVDDGPGDWFADVRAHGRVFVLTHRDGRGFGVSELPTEYGEGPQTVHADHVAAIGRVVELLAVPPTGPTEGES